MFSVRREQGRLAELAPVIRILAADPGRAGAVAARGSSPCSSSSAWRPRRGASSRGSSPSGLDPFRASLWLGSLTYLTDACAALGDEATAALVYPELEPHAGENVMIGHLVACYGAADRYLGMLAATLGEWERAEAHFERALELNRRMGMRTWLAHTAYEYGRGLLAPRARRARARPGAARRGGGARRAHRHAGAARPRPGARRRRAARPRLPDGLSSREVEILALVARGLSNREIGRTLFISEHTAANHMRSILRKTGCANRTEAASYAHRHGLVDP